jgi:phosphate-selective porin OprO/OprP
MRKIGNLLCGGLVTVGLLWASPTLAQTKSVAEEILDILRGNGQISEQQYQDLLNKARAEEENVQAALETKAADPSTFRLYWKEGIRFDSSDGDFKLRIGGRTMNDWTMYDTDEDIRDSVNDGESIGNGTEFRRARLYIQGDIYQNIQFKAEYDFAGSEVAFKDVYIQLKEVPFFGSLTVGHFKEPFSLEELTSSRYITFMERSLGIEAFVPSRNTGFMLSNAVFEERATWAVGAFRDVDDTGDGFGRDSPYNVTARLTALPWYMDEAQLMHLGFSYSHRFRDDPDSVIQFRSRPEAHLGPRFVDTGEFEADGVDLIGPEAALVYGPFSLQGEYFGAFTDSEEFDDPNFDAFYVYASVFLTGEHRVYDMGDGAFDRVSPRRNFDWQGGRGAWEAGFRYASLDLNDEGIEGGELDDFTFGLNWYLNPNVRLMFNYVFADLDDSGEANIFESRLQVDF